MAALGVRREDLEESFTRSGGHGGQNVNKTSTCVRLLHRPSGVEVRCQVHRQQGMNRALALRLLLDKIEATRREAARELRQAAERERRRKRPRSRSAKETMLQGKARRSSVKAMRRRPAQD
jgi:peptide chain release factor